MRVAGQSKHHKRTVGVMLPSSTLLSQSRAHGNDAGMQNILLIIQVEFTILKGHGGP